VDQDKEGRAPLEGKDIAFGRLACRVAQCRASTSRTGWVSPVALKPCKRGYHHRVTAISQQRAGVDRLYRPQTEVSGWHILSMARRGPTDIGVFKEISKIQKRCSIV